MNLFSRSVSLLAREWEEEMSDKAGRTIEQIAEDKMAEDPDVKKRQEMIKELKKAEVIRHTSFEVGPLGVQDHIVEKIANVPSSTLCRAESALVDFINTVFESVTKAPPGDVTAIKDLNRAIIESQQIEQEVSHIHKQALQRIEDRFYTRLVPLNKELKRLNGL